MPFSRFIKQSIIQVKSQLRKLETAHAILVKTEELSILLEVLKPITEEVIQSIIEMVECRQKVFSYQRVLMIGRSGGIETCVLPAVSLTTQYKG